MITLITGLPGNGKTLYAIQYVRELAAKEGREVQYSGIADLKLPWAEVEPERWFEAPPKTIIVIDEVQRVMRPRANGTKVPEFVEKLETHRHLGVDLVLITQHPTLLDANVRRLVGRHFHVVRKWGTNSATVHEWASTKDNCDKQRADSIKHAWKYPKDVFDLYKSAEAHTHRRRIPAKVLVFFSLPFVIAALIWFAWTRYLDPSRYDKKSAAPGATGQVASSGSAAASALTPAAYVAQFTPRVQGLGHTAPAYDELTKVSHVPYPAACLSSGQRCKCYTQQGTALDTSEALCRGIVAGGFFVPWALQPGSVVPAPQPVAESPPYAGSSAPVAIGTSPRGAVIAPF